MVLHNKHPLLFAAFFAVFGVFIPFRFFILFLLFGITLCLFLPRYWKEIGLSMVILAGSFFQTRNHKKEFEFYQKLLNQNPVIQITVDEVTNLREQTQLKTTFQAFVNHNHWEMVPNYRIDIYLKSRIPLVPGTVLLIRGLKIIETAPPIFPGSFDLETFNWGSKRIGSIHLKPQDFIPLKTDSLSLPFWRYRLKSQLANRIKPELNIVAWSWYEGLILGDKTDIDSETQGHFQKAGLMHILSVSGMHLGLIYWILAWPMKRLSKHYKKAESLELLLIPLIWIYSYITGLAPPVLRAAVFLTLILLSRIYFNRKVRLSDLLATAAFFQVVFDPLMCYNISFQLSFGAMLGLAYLYPFWELKFEHHTGFIKWVLDLIGMSLVCTITTLPLILYHFHSFATWFLLGNILFTFPFTVLIYLFVFITVLVDLPLDFIITLSIKLIHSMIEGISIGLEFLDQLPLPFLYAFDFRVIDLLIMVLLLIGMWRMLLGYQKKDWTFLSFMVLIWTIWGYFRTTDSFVSGEVNSRQLLSPKGLHEYSNWLKSQDVDTVYFNSNQ